VAILPKALVKLIEALQKLPGVGPKTAERYAYSLLRSGPDKAQALSSALSNLHNSVKLCPITYALIDADLETSPLYSDPARDKQQIAIVSDAFDVVALESTGEYYGTYHVLGGLISPIDGVGPEELHINELITRCKKDKVNEVILATNASVEGEATALFIQNELKSLGILVSRIARGLPIGVDLGYTDKITLSRAMEGRQKF
jgi:recombination protein RecR